MNNSGSSSTLLIVIVVVLAVIAAVALGVAWARRARRASAPVAKDGAETATLGAATPDVLAPDNIVSDQIVETPVAPAPADLVEHPESTSGRFARLRGRLGATLAGVLHRGSMSANDYDALEEALLLADVGASATDEILAGVKARLGANFEMLGTYLHWLGAQEVAGLADAAAASRRIAEGAKSVQFQLARMVHRRKFDAEAVNLQPLEDDYDAVFATLVARFG